MKKWYDKYPRKIVNKAIENMDWGWSDLVDAELGQSCVFCGKDTPAEVNVEIEFNTGFRHWQCLCHDCLKDKERQWNGMLLEEINGISKEKKLRAKASSGAHGFSSVSIGEHLAAKGTDLSFLADAN